MKYVLYKVGKKVKSTLRPGFYSMKRLGIFLLPLDTWVGDVVCQWLVRRTWDPKVESSSPGRCTHVVFLGKTNIVFYSLLFPCVNLSNPEINNYP